MGAEAMPQGETNRTVIALVDDDRNILTTVSIALQAEGFETRVYSDGETALRALTDNPPDLAVFDIKMPRMDGMELLAKLRERSALPVIFLTSKDDERDEEAGFQMGADDYISKPFSLRLLLARVRAILRRSDIGEVLAVDKGTLSKLIGVARDVPDTIIYKIGAAHEAGPKALAAAGARVIPIGDRPDGLNINSGPWSPDRGRLRKGWPPRSRPCRTSKPGRSAKPRRKNRPAPLPRWSVWMEPRWRSRQRANGSLSR